MMNESDELRAAAERLNDRDLAEYQGPTGYDTDMRAGIMLARAYIAANPADDAEPVTLKWLKTMATATKYDGLMFIGTNQLYVYPNADGDMCAALNASPYAYAVRLLNREQFRLLCRALGITLKEGGK